MRRITIFDTTLRDGEQSPGIALVPDAKEEIALALDRLGVDVIEAGFAASSTGDFDGVRAVAGSVPRATVASMARANEDDVAAAAEALAPARRSRIHVVLGTSPIHMERKLGLEPPEVVERARRCVALAARLADEVEFSCEDATRSEPGFLVEIARAVVEAGASVVNVPDTVGYAVPTQYAELVRDVRRRLPRHVVVSAHCHDDLGLAVANSLAGIAAGASQVECTVNGIGERAGNAALEEVVMALEVRRDASAAETGIDTRRIAETSRLVAGLTGYDVPRNKAIVGANAFAHEAGIHQDGMLKDPSTYQVVDPSLVGLAASLPLGKHSGRHAFAQACRDAGLALDAGELKDAFVRFKRLADTGAAVSLHDVVPVGAS